ncbi:MAG: GNAT family N-acetyltransferase [Candidatus Magasanikbacteria bacterium]
MVIKQITKKEILPIIELSRVIFSEYSSEEDKYHEVEKWKNNLEKDGLILAAFKKGDPIGYIFAYNKNPDDNAIHIWLSGVKKKYRKKGVFTELYSEFLDEIKNQNYQGITINTYKEKFPEMFEFLTSKGFSIYKTKDECSEDKKIEKSYFRKEIN